MNHTNKKWKQNILPFCIDHENQEKNIRNWIEYMEIIPITHFLQLFINIFFLSKFSFQFFFLKESLKRNDMKLYERSWLSFYHADIRIHYDLYLFSFRKCKDPISARMLRSWRSMDFNQRRSLDEQMARPAAHR